MFLVVISVIVVVAAVGVVVAVVVVVADLRDANLSLRGSSSCRMTRPRRPPPMQARCLSLLLRRCVHVATCFDRSIVEYADQWLLRRLCPCSIIGGQSKHCSDMILPNRQDVVADVVIVQFWRP